MVNLTKGTDGLPSNRAFLVIDGETTPIKNGDYMVKKTSINNARELTLKLDSRLFAYKYRTVVLQNSNTHYYDYFIHFEEIVEMNADPLPFEMADEEEENYENFMRILEDDYNMYGEYSEAYNFDHDSYNFRSLQRNMPTEDYYD